MRHFRMELHPEQRQPLVLERRDGRVGAGRRDPITRRRNVHVISVTHPYRGLLAGAEATEQPPVFDPDVGSPVLTAGCPGDVSAREVREELHPVAQAKHGRVQLQELWIGGGDAFTVDGVGTAREDDPLRLPLPDPVHGASRWMDLAVDVGLPHPPGDQLGVLGSEVDDQDAIVM